MSKHMHETRATDETGAIAATAIGTVHLVLLGESEADVPVAADAPPTFGELLEQMGIGCRTDGQLYMNGAPATPETPVLPGSHAVWLPKVRGG